MASDIVQDRPPSQMASDIVQDGPPTQMASDIVQEGPLTQMASDIVQEGPPTIPRDLRPEPVHRHRCGRPCGGPCGPTNLKNEVPGGPKLWRQMVIGFVGAACLGLIMLILGSVFIGKAVKGNTSITVMLCVLGIVCGLIILVGTFILGRLFISRKWRVQEGRQPIHHPPEACFHTCSIIYTPSQDQLNGPPYSDPPPAYEMVVLPHHWSVPRGTSLQGGALEWTEGGGGCGTTGHHSVLMTPPKYSITADPPPEYGDSV